MRKHLKHIICALAILTGFVLSGFGQTFTVKDGKMYIAVEKKVKISSLDSFVRQYDLRELSLREFVFQGMADSLKKQGWKVELENDHLVIISKLLQPLNEISSVENRILITGKEKQFDARFPSVSNAVQIGYNRFRNGNIFRIRDSIVFFFLRGHTDARKVMLSGSFNAWSTESIKMTKTDSGWIAGVVLTPGKYWYKFIADDHWMADPDNRLNENDGMGNTNSVFFVPNRLFKLNGYANAKKVFVSGSFNNWKEKQIELQKSVNGWELPVYLADGTHTYKFIIDDNWIADPGNPEKYPNEFDDYNSVIRIGTPHKFILNGFTDARKVFLSGSFNRWREDEVEMKRVPGGWETEYTLAAGNYEYHFNVDGKQIADPLNPPVSPDTKNSMLMLDPNHEFRLKGYPNAHKVILSGEFNNWNESTQMTKDGDDWVLKVFLSPGKHLYKFIVDGTWIIDPNNKLWEQNEYGTGNSVIWIGR